MLNSYCFIKDQDANFGIILWEPRVYDSTDLPVLKKSWVINFKIFVVSLFLIYLLIICSSGF
jgi:hypothetical protein